MSDWRDDPRWRLSDWDSSCLGERPPDRPPAAAELAQPPIFASLYVGRRPAATWWRPSAEPIPVPAPVPSSAP